ncbi:hypothetical protein [Bradyrhizobium prioriisuperbiae]|uniref:hypothetical protein n=1 Tax=Bradyrhizobium prioriisuperbiae TaxID=2854389 RepID=UPI0028EA74B2|nr:hypothetical protein [Bradyrhizobium prioritasuperba]
MATHDSTWEIFLHVRIIMGVVVALSIARLLSGASRFIQHPSGAKLSWIHLGWVVFMLVSLVHFWWWEFWLSAIKQWTFEIYLVLFGYTIVLYLLCTLLFPDDIKEYRGYDDYFFSRRKWFFGLLALTFVFDLADTLVKGVGHIDRFGVEYVARGAAYFTLCGIAMITPNRRFHAVLVIGSLIYLLVWILRHFETLN